MLEDKYIGLGLAITSTLAIGMWHCLRVCGEGEADFAQCRLEFCDHEEGMLGLGCGTMAGTGLMGIGTQ